MSILARHPFAVAAVVAVIAVLAALLVPLPGQDGGSGAATGDSRAEDLNRPPSKPVSPPSASMSPAAEEQSATVDGLVRRPISMQGRSSLPGLSGTGGIRSLRPRVIRLSATSSEPIGVVGYFVPTSRDRPSGTARGVGRSWSLTTRVYGNPDYAQMFLQAGPSGATITCTITVDGTVTERRSSSGPYGQLFCQG
jgi:hypothetical protein